MWMMLEDRCHYLPIRMKKSLSIVVCLLLVLGAPAVDAWALVTIPSQSRPSASSSPRSRRTRLQSSSSSSSDPVSSTDAAADSNNSKLDDQQYDFMLGYLNKHHTSFLIQLAATFSSIGREMAKANVFSGGSYSIETAVLTDIAVDGMTLAVTVQKRGQAANEERSVAIVFSDAAPVVPKRNQQLPPPVPPAVLKPRHAVDEIARQLIRLCWFVGEPPATTGKLIQLALQLGGDVGKLPENLCVCCRVGALLYET